MINPNFKSLKNFIFDFDGVILDSLETKTEAFYQMYLPYSKEIALKVKKYHLQNGGVSRFEKFKYWHKKYLGTLLNENEILKLSNNFSKLVLQNVINSDEVNGAFNFIKKYSSKYNFFIITGTPQNEINIIIEKIKLQNYFKEVLGSPKNKIEWCNYLLNKFDLVSSETIFLGDALSDYEAAKHNDFHFALRSTSYNKDLFFNINNKIDFKDFYSLERLLCQRK